MRNKNKRKTKKYKKKTKKIKLQEDTYITSKKKNITKYNNGYRCCYLLKNGKRCKNKCLGIQRVKSFITNKYENKFIVHCSKHFNECKNKYKKYKDVCKKIYNTLERKKFLNKNICNKKTKKKKRKKIIRNINKCILGRLHYPLNCSNGCIIHPYNFKTYNAARNNDIKHYYEINKLILNKLKCEKNMN